MIYRDFLYESVFRHLRTGFTGICRGETVDAMENYVLAVGDPGKEPLEYALGQAGKGCGDRGSAPAE